jgi:hypothetical protein
MGIVRVAWMPLVLACQNLSPISHEVCGNGVVEQGEDCDSAIDPALGNDLACAPAGSADACRYTCTTASCPEGWACGDDGVCRHATGELRAEPPQALSHDELAIGDIDGDRGGELVTFDERGARVAFADRSVIPASPDHLTGPGAVIDVDGDGRADVVSPIGEGIEIERGELDRSVTPTSYTPFPAAPGAWFLPVRIPISDEGDALAAILSPPPSTTATSVQLFRVPSGASDHVVPLTTDTPANAFGPTALRVDLDALSGEDELIVAASGRPRFWSLSPTLTLFDKIAMVPDAVELPAGFASDGHLLAADVDADDDLDVLAGVLTPSGEAVVIARNEGGTLSDAVIYTDLAELANPHALGDVPSAPRPFPLAIADLDGDGDLDAVSPDAVFLRTGTTLTTIYRRSTTKPWREAITGDLDRDGRLEVVLASDGVGLDVLRNTGSGFARVAIDTAGSVSMLRAGDFDGDGLVDVAFRERASRDRVRVLFGAVGAFAPTVAALGLPAVTRLEVGRLRDSRALEDAVDDFVVVGFDGARSGVSFATGSGDRKLRSPLFLTRGSLTDVPVGAVAGHFVTRGSALDLAVLANDRGGERWLWIFPAAENAGYRIDTARTSAPLGMLGSLALVKLAAADVDADGIDELVALGRTTGGATQLVIARPTESGPPRIDTFDPRVGDALDLAIGDLDRDGRAELLVAGTAGLALWRDGALTPLSSIARSVCVAQLDLDPSPELAVLADDHLDILDGTTHAVQQSIPVTRKTRIVRAGDLDGDGLADLVLGDGLTVTRYLSTPQVAR